MLRDWVIGSRIGESLGPRLILMSRDKNYKSGFKKPGKDGMGIYRAVLVSGPPGIGKTTSAHLMAKEAGYNPIELNASDARSKKLVEVSRIWTSLAGVLICRTRRISITRRWMAFSAEPVFRSAECHTASPGIADEQSTTVAGIRVGTRTCLIMDEVDGMSAGDRGGVGALNVLIKKTKVSLACSGETMLMEDTDGLDL
jgi:replication factor C subunit 1